MAALSEHFDSSEFPGWDRATPLQRENLRQLVSTILQPIRRRWGPIIVTSWLRGTGVHATGAAVDFYTPDDPAMKEVWTWAATHLTRSFGELIHEPPLPHQNTAHIHVTLWGFGGQGQALVEVHEVQPDGTVKESYAPGWSRLALIVGVILAGLTALATIDALALSPG